jgi:hypothetical protein
MRRNPAVWLAVVGNIAVVCSQAPAPLVIRGATPLDVAAGGARSPATVVIENGRVISVSTEPAAPLPADARVVDATGAFIIPGLADLEVHATPGATIDFDYYATASLACGVTDLVIDARSGWSKDQKLRASAGEIMSPQLFLRGPDLVSARPGPNSGVPDLARYTTPMLVSDPAQAAGVVATLKAAAVDWVRIRGDVPANTATAVVAAARRAGLRTMTVTGGTSLIDALSTRADVVLGLGAFGQTTASNGATPRDADALAATVVASWARARDADVVGLARRLAKASPGRVIAPQFLLNARMAGINPAEGPLDVRRALELLPRPRRQELEASWKRVANKSSPESRAAWRQQQLFVKTWAEAGGTLAVASGAGDVGWPIPGFAVHHEAALLVAAGLSTSDALRAATAGDLFGASRAWTRGSGADFFVVDGNPLDDLSNLSRIRLVVRRGEVLEPARLLADAARAIRAR